MQQLKKFFFPRLYSGSRDKWNDNCKLHNLPNEILGQILTYLDLRSLQACKNSSRRLRNIATPLWWSDIVINPLPRDYFEHSNKFVATINELLSNSHRFCNLKLIIRPQDWCIFKEVNFVNLEMMQISFSVDPTSASDFEEGCHDCSTYILNMLPKIQRLKHLEFPYFDFRAISAENLHNFSLSSLRTLRFDQVVLGDSHQLKLFLSKCELLNNILLGGRTWLGTAVMSIEMWTEVLMTRNLRRIALLNFDLNEILPNEAAPYQNFLIEELKIFGGCTDYNLSAIFATLPALSKLTMFGLAADRTYHSLNHTVGQLEKFACFDQIENFTEIAATLSSSINLRHIEIGATRLNILLESLTAHPILEKIVFWSTDAAEVSFFRFFNLTDSIKQVCLVQDYNVSANFFNGIVKSKYKGELCVNHNASDFLRPNGSREDRFLKMLAHASMNIGLPVPKTKVLCDNKNSADKLRDIFRKFPVLKERVQILYDRRFIVDNRDWKNSFDLVADKY
ncbi:hypothetical protein BKA69DRAFT_944423 [Paraphysoderma sedebokerense]|nr:hypothetical protein BKA69DRAFT_944423 [Paraphysoderma sedebokerense]